MAMEGYWRNWERNTVWQTREIIYQMIQGNPYIKGNKPSSPKDIYRMRSEKINEEVRKITPEELEEAQNILKGIIKRN